jgi:hypothetical protein
MKTKTLITSWEKILIEKSHKGKPLEINQVIANNTLVTFMYCGGEIVVNDDNLTRIPILPFTKREEAYDEVVKVLEGKMK